MAWPLPDHRHERPSRLQGRPGIRAYTYTLQGTQLALKAGFDQCSGRKTILTAHPLTKIASPSAP